MLESYIPVSLNGEGDVAAFFEIKTLKYGRRMVILLNKKNEIHAWIEEFYHGCGWFHYDCMCGHVSHNEMVAVFVD